MKYRVFMLSCIIFVILVPTFVVWASPRDLRSHYYRELISRRYERHDIYSGNGLRLSADSSNVELVGRMPFGSALDVYTVGNYAYLCAGGTLVILDVSNPSDPIEVGRIDTPGIAYGVHVLGDCAYVADEDEGLRVIDVSDPTNPHEVGFCDTPGHEEGVYVVGQYAYVASSGLRVIDVSDPTNPHEVGSCDTPGGAEDVHVVGNYAYVADDEGGLRVIDVSDATNPHEVGLCATPEWAVGVHVVGDYAYVAVEDVGLRVIDISDPANPHEVGFCDTPEWAEDVHVVGNYAYVASGWEGLYVMDISDPINPHRVGFCDTPEWAVGVHVVGNYAYVADDEEGLWVIDVSDPTNPHEVGFYDTPGWSEDVHVAGNYAYVASGWEGLYVMDISDPTNPQEVGSCETPGWAYGVYVVGRYAYVAGWGLHVIDISDPANPNEVGYCDTPGWTDVYVAGGYAYMTGDGLRVIDVSDPTNPHEVGSCDTPEWAEGVHVVGDYAYVAGEEEGLRVIDVSDPTNPHEVGSCGIPVWAFGVYVVGNYAYVADEDEGLRVIDVSDPTNPHEVGFCNTGYGAEAVHVSGDYAYVVGSELYVIDVSDPTNPRQVGFYDIPGWGAGVHVAEGYVYVAGGRGGLLYILRFTGAVPTIEPDINLSAQHHDFGNILVGDHADWNLIISNVGDANLTVNSITSDNPVFTIASPSFPQDIATGGSLDVTVRFSPSSEGSYTGNLTITSNDPDEPQVHVSVVGATIEPDINLSAQHHDFGNILVGHHVDWNLIISNVGDANLTVNSITSDNPVFAIASPSFPQDIATGGSLDVTVRFSPLSEGSYSGNLTITSNDPDEPQVHISVEGIATIEPDINLSAQHHDFGGILVEDHTDWNLIISNVGDANLTVNSITSDNPVFTVISPSFPQTIVPDGSLDVTVRFSPSSEGVYTGNLTITSNDPDEPQVHVSVLGVTIQGTLQLGQAQSITMSSGELLRFGLTIPQADMLFLTLQKVENTWYATLTLKQGGQTIASQSGSGDLILQVKNPAPGSYMVEVKASASGQGILKAGLDELPLGEWKVRKIYRYHGLDWCQVQVPEDQPSLVIEVEILGTWSELDVWRDEIGSQEHWRAEAEWKDGGNVIELLIPDPAAGTYYLRVEDSALISGTGSQVRDYMIRADTSRQTPIRIDNAFVRIEILPDRAAVSSLVFKQGSNQELIQSRYGRYLIDLGSEDPRLAIHLKSGWQLGDQDVQAAYAIFDFSHSSGFQKRLLLSWSAQHVEARCDLTAPEQVVINNNLAPGGTTDYQRDHWAVPGASDILTGDFTYPWTYRQVYPAASGEWGKPSEGWISFWDDGVDEVYGFTFSPKYSVQIGEDFTTHFKLKIPAGSSTLAFQIRKPKTDPAYEAIQALGQRPVFTIAKLVDQRFTAPDAILTYAIEFANTGSGQATQTMMEDTLPPELTYVSGSVTGDGTYDPPTRSLSWDIGALDAGDSPQQVSFQAQVNPSVADGTDIVNIALIFCAELPIPDESQTRTTIATPTITGVSPSTGGNTGAITVTITGRDLDPESKATLVRPGEEAINGYTVSGRSDGTQLTVQFDLTEKAAGMWDVVVTNPNGQSSTTEPESANDFEIEPGGEPKLWVEIIGREQLRIGRKATYIVRCGNSGTVDANGAILWVSFPTGVQCEFQIPVPEEVIENKGQISPENDTNTIAMFVPKVPMDSVYDLRLALTDPIGIDNVSIKTAITFVQEGTFSYPTIFAKSSIGNFTDSPPPGYLLFRKAPLIDLHVGISLGDGTCVDIILPSGSTPRHIPIEQFRTEAGDYKGAYAPWFYTNTEDCPLGDKVAEIALNVFNEQKLGYWNIFDLRDVKGERGHVHCGGLAELIYELAGKKLDYHPEGIIPNDKPEFLSTGLLYHLCGGEEDIPIIPGPVVWIAAWYLSGGDSDVIWAVLERFVDAYRMFKSQTSLIVRSVTSVSPEDKYGPTGYDSEDTGPGHRKRFVRSDEQFEYRIDFWNKEDAPVPTQDVFIEDQLDANLNWSTFEFRDFGFLKWNVPVPPGLKQLDETVDLRPDMSLLVRVQANIDTSGKVSWIFNSLDPYTGEPPEDPQVGFLPPITDTGYEIGWVNYKVKSKANLSTGTQISNQAFVKFDVGPWKPAPPNPDSEIPGYGPWVNTIDSGAPTSYVKTLPTSVPSTTFTVEWEGVDGENGSGIRDYTICVSEDGNTFTEWLSHSTQTSSAFTGLPEHTYYFYSRAEDNVGNVEKAPSEADVVTTISKAAGPHWILISMPFKLPDNSLDVVLQSIDGHYSSAWTYDAANSKWRRYFANGPTWLNDLETIVAGKGYWIHMADSTPLIVDGDELADEPIELEQGWNLVGYNYLTAKAVEEALSSIAGNYNSVWTYSATDGGWKRYFVDRPANNLETMEPWKGYWMDAKVKCAWDVNATTPPAAPPVAERGGRSYVLTDRPGIPYTIWGSIEANGMGMTSRMWPRPPSVVLKIDNKTKARYRLGELVQYGDYYVLDVPETTDGSTQIELYVQFEDSVTKAASISPGRPGETMRLDLYVQTIPKTSLLHQNYPNPSNPDTWIPYQLKEDANVVIRIYAATGQLVRALNLGPKPAGFYTTKVKAAFWDGKNEAGEHVASGIYFYTIQAGEFTATKKMVVAR